MPEFLHFIQHFAVYFVFYLS